MPNMVTEVAKEMAAQSEHTAPWEKMSERGQNWWVGQAWTAISAIVALGGRVDWTEKECF